MLSLCQMKRSWHLHIDIQHEMRQQNSSIAQYHVVYDSIITAQWHPSSLACKEAFCIVSAMPECLTGISVLKAGSAAL